MKVVEVKKCPHGKGVFALKKFKRGEIIAVVKGGEIRKIPASKYDMKVGENEYWSDFPPENPDYWSNFLDNTDVPNCRFIDFNAEKLQAKLIAVNDISAGEELFINYDEIPNREVMS